MRASAASMARALNDAYAARSNRTSWAGWSVMSGDREMWAGGTAGLQSEVLYLAVELAGRIRLHDSNEEGRRLKEDDSFLSEAAGRLGCTTAQIAAKKCHSVGIGRVRNRADETIDCAQTKGGGVCGRREDAVPV